MTITIPVSTANPNKAIKPTATATHILLVTPLIFLMTKEYELRKFGKIDVLEVKH